MNAFLRAGHALLLATALVFVGLLSLVAWDVHRQLGHFGETLTNVNFNLGLVAGAAADVQDAIADQHKAVTKQMDALTVTTQQTGAAAASVRKLLDHLDVALADPHSGLLPAAADLLRHQDAELVALERQATANLAELQTSTKQLNALLANASTAAANAAALSADPALRESLARLDAAMEKTNDLLANIDAIAASGNRVAQMVETRLRQALKPASLAKQIFTRALGLAGPAAQVATAAQHK